MCHRYRSLPPAYHAHTRLAHASPVPRSWDVIADAVNVTVASQLMVKRVQGAKIACLDFNLMKTKMKMGV